jgi:hypothetical protein
MGISLCTHLPAPRRQPTTPILPRAHSLTMTLILYPPLSTVFIVDATCCLVMQPPLLPSPFVHLSSPQHMSHTLTQQHRFYFNTTVLTMLQHSTAQTAQTQDPGRVSVFCCLIQVFAVVRCQQPVAQICMVDTCTCKVSVA